MTGKNPKKPPLGDVAADLKTVLSALAENGLEVKSGSVDFVIGYLGRGDVKIRFETTGEPPPGQVDMFPKEKGDG